MKPLLQNWQGGDINGKTAYFFMPSSLSCGYPCLFEKERKKEILDFKFFFSSVDIIEKPLKNDDINDESGSQSSLLQVRDRLN